MQNYGVGGALATGSLLLPWSLASLSEVDVRGLISSQPVSQPADFGKNSGLEVFFEEKGEVGAVEAGAAGFVLEEKLA